MTGTSRIFITKKAGEADQTASFWEGHPDGYSVHIIRGADEVKVQAANPPETLWETDAAGPWYGVLVTRNA